MRLDQRSRPNAAAPNRAQAPELLPQAYFAPRAPPPSPGGGGTANPFDKTLRAAVAARNKAKFEAVRAERNRLRADAAEAEIDAAKLRRRIAELETRLAQQPHMVPPPPARVFDAAPGSGW